MSKIKEWFNGLESGAQMFLAIAGTIVALAAILALVS